MQHGTMRPSPISGATAPGRALGVATACLRALLVLFACLGAGGSLAQTADAIEPRIALVVGNGAYTQVPGLANAVPDARLIGERLEATGFEVILIENADLGAFQSAIVRFGRRLREAGPQATGLFYYAGHAVQSFGNNYLLPTSLALTDQADLDLVALEASAILRQMRSARNRTNIVILDACRNNPFEAILAFNENGLAEMKAPTGTFLAYATAPGEVALDGVGGNSPFTTALASRMLVPGAPIEGVFRQVRIDVIEATGGRQTPWDTSSLTREFQFVEALRASPEELAETSMWETVRETREAVQIALFLRAFPKGRYESDARALLAEVATGVPSAPRAPEPAMPVAPSTPATPTPAAPRSESSSSESPSGEERALFERAQAEATVEGFEAYLDAYPAGTFAEFARMERAALASKLQLEPAPAELTASLDLGPPPTPPAETVMPDAPEDVVASLTPADSVVTFAAPLAIGSPDIVGRSLEQLIAGSPLFPPIEGLPDDFWKGQPCANCHAWRQENLCDQASTYLAKDEATLLAKPHPYGGSFKTVLKAWAEGDCK